MRNMLSLMTAVLILLACNHATDAQEHQTQNSIQHHLFSLSEAERILGQQAHLTDSASITGATVSTYKCTYKTKLKDQKTGKPGLLDFLFEQYDQVISAQKVYASIKLSNERHQGFKELQGMGDEAYFHSDGQNFIFIIVRKGDKMFRMKVNKPTSTTSLEQFNAVARHIAAAL